MRIAMQLVDARGDSNLWSHIFERELADVFALQSEIASAVVAELKIATGGRLHRYDATTNMDAYDYYLRGSWYFHNWTQHSMQHARQPKTIDSKVACLQQRRQYQSQLLPRDKKRQDYSGFDGSDALTLAVEIFGETLSPSLIQILVNEAGCSPY